MHRDPILQQIWVRGEISNFKHHPSGHMYFTLKDETDLIRCVWFRQNQADLTFVPCNGMKVLVNGHVSLYCKDGQYQLYAESMEKDGIGDLYAAFEDLKKKLREQGYFDSEHKKPLPKYPRHIAIITSHTGAAVRDIINVIHRRFPCVNLLIIPVLVQGSTAAMQICAALDYVNTRKDIDCIIIGRGGGSIEDLWAFNDEKLAYAIWRSDIPVVSAVGHETDYTIADFVSDLRAPTPSAAGEIVVPELNHVRSNLEALQMRLVELTQNLIAKCRENLDRIINSYIFRHPLKLIEYYQQDFDQTCSRLLNSIQLIIDQKKKSLSNIAAYLEALSPLSTLSRGYALIISPDKNEIVTSINQLQVGSSMYLKLKDGKAVCNILDKKSDQASNQSELF